MNSCPTRLLGCYGCEWVETPNLDRFAALSTVYDSHYRSENLLIDQYAGERFSFDSQGIKAALKSGSPLILLDWNPFGELEFDAVDWQNKSECDEFFGDLAAVMTGIDEEFGEMVGLLSGYDLVLTADHGLPLGEHDFYGLENDCRLHEERLHLPLIVCEKDGKNAGHRHFYLTKSESVYSQTSELLLPKADFVYTFNENEHSIRTEEYTLLESKTTTEQASKTTSASHLYNFKVDRYEVNNLYERSSEIVEKLREIR